MCSDHLEGRVGVVLHGLEELDEQPPHHSLVLAQSGPQNAPPRPGVAVVKVARFYGDSPWIRNYELKVCVLVPSEMYRVTHLVSGNL